MFVCRVALCFGAVFLLWDVRPVFYALWGPLDWLVGYSDPRKAGGDWLHGTWHSTYSTAAVCVCVWVGGWGYQHRRQQLIHCARAFYTYSAPQEQRS